MAFQTKKSRMAIVAETTEGTPAFPASGADFLAMHGGFSTELTFEELENEELRASIGKAKSIVGFESPAASIPHYLRHSGVEGQAPQAGYSALLEATFGSKFVTAVQDTAAAASTTTTVKVASTAGYRIGQGLLVKHASFAWEIAVVYAIPNATDLTLLFALANAPVAGTGLGKTVHYQVVDSSHPSLSVHDYRGNGGAYALLAGMRVSEMAVEAEAGQLIKGSWTLGGIKQFFDPIRITATDTKLDFNETGPTLRVATIAAGVYKTPIDLARAIETAMNAVATDAITVTYSNTTGKFTIATGGTLLSLLWNTGANAANTIGDKIGFSTAADDTGFLTYTSDNAQDWSSPFTPAFDSPGDPLVAKGNDLWIGQQSDNMCVCARVISFNISEPKTDELCVCSDTAKNGSIINEREATLIATVSLPQHKADWFQGMVDNTSLRSQWNFGQKSGGNWVAGKSGALHLKDASMTVHNLGDADGLVVLELEIKAHVDASGNPEMGLNLL